MKSRLIPKHPIKLTYLILFFLIPHLLPAQDDEDEEDIYELQPVTVVGTRLRGIDLETTLPVQVFTTKDLDLTGYTRVDDTLRDLPIMTGSSPNSEVNLDDVGSYGTRGLNMRGMGAAANLILVNGLRIPFFDGGGSIYPYYNIASIPMGSIESVQVLADGASAVYGSDAVSGVIDFRTIQEYEGTRVTFDLGTYEGTQSDEAAMTLVHGRKVGSKGNLVIALNHYERNNLKWGEYEFWEDANFLDMGGVNQNSSMTYPAIFVAVGESNPYYNNAFTFDEPTSDPNLNDMVVQPWPIRENDGGYNYNTVMDKLGDNKETGLYLHFDYEFKSSVRAFVELYHQRTYTRFQAAASPYWSSFNWPVPASNPFNPIGVARTDGEPPNNIWYIRGRLVDGGPREAESIIKVPRIVAGLKGKIGSTWTWQLAGVASESTATNFGNNYFDQERFLEVVNGYDLNGDGELSNDEYFNPFGPNSDALYDHFRIEQTRTDGSYELWMVDAHATGDIWRNNQIAFSAAIGAEFRSERMHYELDEYIGEGRIIGGDPANSNVFGKRDVAAAYSEFQLTYKDILTVLGAGRLEKYSDSGSVETPKISFSLEILPEVMIRGSYGEGYVAPTLPVMFKPQAVSYINGEWFQLKDPKRDEEMDYPIRLKNGGNPDLEPETSTNYTAGIVVEPFTRIKESNFIKSSLKGLTFGSSYNQIDYINLWSYPNIQFLLNNEDQLHEIYPNQDVKIIREHGPNDDPNEIPKVVQINQLWANEGSFHKHKSYDFWMELPVDLEDWGLLNLRWDGTHLAKASDTGDDWAGGSVYGLPDFTWVATIQWQRKDWSTALYFREISGVPRDPNEPETPTAEASFRINAQVSYSGWKETQITVGVRNLMDEDPSFSGYPPEQGYHWMHPRDKRFWYVKIKKNF